ncbi:uncharacterized protein LOC125946102 [Dermacentor silvarum]|uniref:uncharacterized protein LOC125946102 n=1 Tax=Dermacentor silvarum TaxID=543639 RepID=UPI0021019E17|nr:uncharacterized protein LOC125946102 [Dermacentor silvarum]
MIQAPLMPSLSTCQVAPLVCALLASMRWLRYPCTTNKTIWNLSSQVFILMRRCSTVEPLLVVRFGDLLWTSYFKIATRLHGFVGIGHSKQVQKHAQKGRVLHRGNGGNQEVLAQGCYQDVGPRGRHKQKNLALVCDHLVVHGETAESMARHTDWLKANATTSDDTELRPRLLATARARREQLRTVNVTEALLLFPFLSTEASLLMEFDILFKCDILNNMEAGLAHLLNVFLKNGKEEEIATLSAASGKFRLLCTLVYITFTRCICHCNFNYDM